MTRLRNSTSGIRPSAMTVRACGWDMRSVWAFLGDRAIELTERLYGASIGMSRMSDRIIFVVSISVCAYVVVLLSKPFNEQKVI